MTKATAKCELCGKEKKIKNMDTYYYYKRTDSNNIMYKCKNCNEN